MKLDHIAAVVGSAECWQSDLARFREEWGEPGTIIAVNDAAWMLGGEGFAHWVTLHPEKLVDWVRHPDVFNKCVTADIWTGTRSVKAHPSELVDHYTGHWGVGSSGLFGVKVALEDLKIPKVVLCGVPITPTAYAEGAGEHEGGTWPDKEVQIHREGWEYNATKRLQPVRSMSGWTAELLGEPDGEWAFPWTEDQKLMDRFSVMPPLEHGYVQGGYWHCPCCGATTIYKTQPEKGGYREGSYHCTDCGRDFTVIVTAVPWWRYGDLRERYPAAFFTE